MGHRPKYKSYNDKISRRKYRTVSSHPKGSQNFLDKTQKVVTIKKKMINMTKPKCNTLLTKEHSEND